MSTYELICLTILVLILLVTIANVVVGVLRKRQRDLAKELAGAQAQQDTIDTSSANVEPSHDEVYVQDTSEVSVASEDYSSEQIIAAFASGKVEETDNRLIVINADGTTTYYRLNKSFQAKLIQAKDEVRNYYNNLKNFVLCYQKVKTGISWNQENVRFGKEKVCWFVLRGKSLYLYLPLNPDDFAETKYKVERAKAKRYDELPCMYKITSQRKAKCATELIAMVMEKLGSEFEQKEVVNYVDAYPYEDTPSLIERKQIKITKTKSGGFGAKVQK